MKTTSGVSLSKFFFNTKYITAIFILTFTIVSFLHLNHNTNNINVTLDMNLSIKTENTMQLSVNGKVLEVRLEKNVNRKGLQNVLGKGTVIVDFQ